MKPFALLLILGISAAMAFVQAPAVCAEPFSYLPPGDLIPDTGEDDNRLLKSGVGANLPILINDRSSIGYGSMMNATHSLWVPETGATFLTIGSKENKVLTPELLYSCNMAINKLLPTTLFLLPIRNNAHPYG